MLPASFIPKLIKMVAPSLTTIIMEHIAKVFKMQKLLDYMELPNDLDRGVEKLQVENEMLKSQMKDMTDSINKLNNKFDKVKKLRSL